MERPRSRTKRLRRTKRAGGKGPWYGDWSGNTTQKFNRMGLRYNRWREGDLEHQKAKFMKANPGQEWDNTQLKQEAAGKFRLNLIESLYYELYMVLKSHQRVPNLYKFHENITNLLERIKQRLIKYPLRNDAEIRNGEFYKKVKEFVEQLKGVSLLNELDKVQQTLNLTYEEGRDNSIDKPPEVPRQEQSSVSQAPPPAPQPAPKPAPQSATSGWWWNPTKKPEKAEPIRPFVPRDAPNRRRLIGGPHVPPTDRPPVPPPPEPPVPPTDRPPVPPTDRPPTDRPPTDGPPTIGGFVILPKEASGGKSRRRR
jgi:hypothetical protein